MSKQLLFTQTQKDQIAEAVKQAEQNTSGEIVPYFVNKSDNYIEAPTYAALSAGVFVVLILNILSQLWLLPFKFNTLNFSIWLIVIMAVVYLTVYFIKPIKRLIINDSRKSDMVNKRAMLAFVEEEVFSTRDRTGILIFVSEFEHRVEIIADSGINTKTDDAYWTELIEHLIEGIKKGDLTESVIDAIAQCGKLLADAGFSVSPDDTNEIDNNLRTEEI
ncbi:MAG: hypothetical protein U9N85_02710 [Bacteroidota bacterium]|nr:hypothetical protein [Bacteroidota bacterium]